MDSRSQQRPQIRPQLRPGNTELALDQNGHLGGELTLAVLEVSYKGAGDAEFVGYVLL
jgi:hypothetical protein